jgi:hypothetical protein
MARAYRTPVNARYFPEIEELEQREDYVGSVLVRCPVEGCSVEYQFYNFLFSDAEENENALLYTLHAHHPEHTQGKIVVNEPNSDFA